MCSQVCNPLVDGALRYMRYGWIIMVVLPCFWAVETQGIKDAPSSSGAKVFKCYVAESVISGISWTSNASSGI